MGLPARHRCRCSAGVGQLVRRRQARRQGREDRRARQRRRVRQPRALQESPDLKPIRFAKGYDFCARTSNGLTACEGRDPYPNDDYGHGTHVVSTIAETPNNGLGLTGLAYGVTIIPVKVLNARGEGDEETIAEGIRFAVKRGAQIINLSFEFGSSRRRQPRSG